MAINKLENILSKALNEKSLSREEILLLLRLTKPEEREQLYWTARELRQGFFHDKVFLYGFVFFSTFCRNNCSFCYYRKANNSCERYRKTNTEIIDIACALAESGVHLVDLTMGEDPEFLTNHNNGYEKLIEIVRLVKKYTRLPLMISPGLVPRNVMVELKKAGADWYALYQETHNRSIYEQLRLNQSYDKRWNSKVFAKTMGMLVEEGLLVGVGDTADDVADSLHEMKILGAEQIRTMSFVPQLGTPLYSNVVPDNMRELNIIAVMRILFPDRLIPASLDVEGIIGMKARLDAGANVVTSLIPPEGGLVGVSQSTLDIAEGFRTVKGILPVLEECRLFPAAPQDYLNWMQLKQGAYGAKATGGNLVCE